MDIRNLKKFKVKKKNTLVSVEPVTGAHGSTTRLGAGETVIGETDGAGAFQGSAAAVKSSY